MRNWQSKSKHRSDLLIYLFQIDCVGVYCKDSWTWLCPAQLDLFTTYSLIENQYFDTLCSFRLTASRCLGVSIVNTELNNLFLVSILSCSVIEYVPSTRFSADRSLPIRFLVNVVPDFFAVVPSLIFFVTESENARHCPYFVPPSSKTFAILL